MPNRMNMLQGILKEELENSNRRLLSYQKQLKGLPKGTIYRRLIKGRPYWYVERMVKGKVVNQYKGAFVPEEEIQKFQKAKEDRVEYRKALKLIKKQVAVLERAVGSLERNQGRRPSVRNHAK